MPHKTFAVLVGINYYGTESELRGCHNDVDLMFGYLRKCGVEDFLILKDHPADFRHDLVDCPTKSNIIRAIKDTYARMNEGDTFIFHYSGHGTSIRDQGKKDERDGRDECICPADYAKEGFLIDDDLNKLLVQPLLQAPQLQKCKLRAVFDSCHSGSVLDLPVTVVSKHSIIQENRSCASCDVVCFSGCKDAQTSADAQIAGQGQGAATYALWSALESLKSSGTWMDVLLTMQAQLKRERFSQVACLSVPSLAHTANRCDLLLPAPLKKPQKSSVVAPVVMSVEELMALMKQQPQPRSAQGKRAAPAPLQTSAVPRATGGLSRGSLAAGNSGRQ